MLHTKVQWGGGGGGGVGGVGGGARTEKFALDIVMIVQLVVNFRTECN